MNKEVPGFSSFSILLALRRPSTLDGPFFRSRSSSFLGCLDLGSFLDTIFSASGVLESAFGGGRWSGFEVGFVGGRYIFGLFCILKS